ncbi:MAG TPA: TolC family protein [Polyangiales bacterium]|nr:TolC family protein [Polyangiales bacterium]
MLLSLFVASSADGQAHSVPLDSPTRTLRSWSEAKQLLDAHQPSLREARASITRAHAGVKQALARLLPRIDVSAGTDFSPVYQSFGPRDEPAPHEILDFRSLVPNAGAALSVTFSIADLVQLESAEVGVDAETLGLRATRHALIGTLASSVLGVLAAERVAARNHAGLEAARERMRLTERLAAVGKLTALDALRFSDDLSEAESAVISADETLFEVREDLGGALGLPQPVTVLQDFDVSAPAVGCKPLAQLRDRADRRAARKRAESAELAERAAGLAYLPELRFVTQYEASYGGIGVLSPFDGERAVAHRWTASANVVWTVFEGGQRSADSARAAAERLAAQAALDATEIATSTEYRRAVRLVSVTRASLDVALRSLEAAQKADTLSRKALELGSASALELIDAARRLRSIESTVATREVEWLAAQLRAQLAISDCG